MKIKKAAAIPLITCDPLFSIWSPHDKLTDGDTTHWSGNAQTIKAYLTIDGLNYCFLGDSEFCPILEQSSLEVTCTKTKVTFEHKKLSLTVTFTTPLLLDQPTLVSRPLTYIDFTLNKKTDCEVTVNFKAFDNIIKNDNDDVVGGNNNVGEILYSVMGKSRQAPLSQSGDNNTINWGNLYIATKDGTTKFENNTLNAVLPIENKASLMIAYDDLVSINYFGEFVRGYWTKNDGHIINAIVNASADYNIIMQECDKLDKKIEKLARQSGGDDYVFLCNMSYRHTISAHKLIENSKGELIFLSKENDSNGCIGTADVSYPSIPLFMLFGSKYIKGMVRPIMDFANCDVWEYDFAPHDVGRYPYAWGQVYGVNTNSQTLNVAPDRMIMKQDDKIFPAYYLFPKGSDIFYFEKQMPVEECGNMIVMIANICKLDDNANFALPYIKTLEKWVQYLVKYGSDPENQLCTDDFAGHLAHNVNLAFKAVVGIEGYAQILKILGQEDDYNKYHKIAKDMASDCVERAKTDNHTKLTFDNETSWSLKYNMIWDLIWKTELFDKKIIENEVNFYIQKANEYGTPLDSRSGYTKSDWLLWVTAMTNDIEKRKKLITPVKKFLENSPSRYPFSDWYQTESGEYCHFKARSVQGGIFMPILIDQYFN